MDVLTNATDTDNMTTSLRCKDPMNRSFDIISLFIMFIVFTSCKAAHLAFRLIGQPRLITEITVGLIIGNMKFMDESLARAVPQFLHSITEFGMVCYMLVLGLEMDPSVLFRRPTREAIVAYAGMFSSFIIVGTMSPLLPLTKTEIIEFTLSLSITLSGTASPVLTRLITDLKIGKSDIGRLAVRTGMHTDMFSMLVITLTFIVHPPYESSPKWNNVAYVFIALLTQTVFTIKVVPSFVNWINNSNPDGKPMKGSHLVLSIAFMSMLCSFGPAVGYSPILSSFLVGLAFPRHGRLSKMMISKINYFLASSIFPLYLCWVGELADFGELGGQDKLMWIWILFLFIIATAGKVIGTLVSGVLLGFNWPEATALGLLLNVKGHFHIFIAAIAKQQGIINNRSFIITIFLAILTIVYIPLVVSFIVKRARSRSPNRQMMLQHLGLTSELRMLFCLHGTHSVPTSINIMEISRGGEASRVTVYATDIIELNDCTAAMLVQGDGLDIVTVSDESVVNMREQITSTIQAYINEKGEGITVRRLLAISSFANMHQDLCNLVEHVLAYLIILPFHKNHPGNDLHPGFRLVNRKVLRHAPCSVGILVDRGIGLINMASASILTLRVAVIFIGGKDDREALAYSRRVAQHPGVNLTAIRFLLDPNANKASTRTNRKRFITDRELEMKLDDECFTEFYEKHVADGRVSYSEKYVINAAETVSTLRTLGGTYDLLIIGRGGRVNSTLTAGMSDWKECPELGLIGNILTDSDFSSTASVLVIQQHSPKGDLEGLDEDFSIM